MGLNPYSNGMKIERCQRQVYDHARYRLNPYSNGMKIELSDGSKLSTDSSVLILILME